jgi:uncharacterized Fe-S cluster protein YjdI
LKRRYSNGQITVYWDSEKCEHAGFCFRLLPGVFKPSKRPWILIDAASPEEIRKTINKCPTGALSCKLHQSHDNIS